MRRKFSFRARYVRQHPDPNFENSKIWNLTVPVLDLPLNLPFFNPRDQDLDRKVYKTIKAYLRGEFGDPLFYQMNRGITIVAEKVLVKRTAERLEDRVTLIFSGASQGILDGGHTYSLICNYQTEQQEKKCGFENHPAYREMTRGLLKGAGGDASMTVDWKPTGGWTCNADENNISEAACLAVLGENWRLILKGQVPDRPTNEELALLFYASHPYVQFVKVQVHTGLRSSVVQEMARGLNTGMQVSDSTMADFEGRYDWIKDELSAMPYFAEIAFRQYADGIVAIEDIVRMLEAFNVADFPVHSGEHPVFAACETKKTVGRFLANSAKYELLRPILRDILKLYDIISFEAWEIWRGKSSVKTGRAPVIFNSKARGDRRYPFIDKKRGLPLFEGTLFPIFSAFRSMVDIEDGNAKWRNSFEDVLIVWRSIGRDLLKTTYRTARAKGGAISAVVRDRNLWDILFTKVLNASRTL